MQTSLEFHSVTDACQHRPSAALRHKAETAPFKELKLSTSKQLTFTGIIVLSFFEQCCPSASSEQTLWPHQDSATPASCPESRCSKVKDKWVSLFLPQPDLCRTPLQLFLNQKNTTYHFVFFSLFWWLSEQKTTHNLIIFIKTQLRYTVGSRCFCGAGI